MTLHQSSFLTENGYKAYVTYLALKRHFETASYDYHKYEGKTRVSFETFTARNDAYSFQKLSKHRDYHGLILSNIVLKPKLWIGDLLEDSANANYLEWKRKHDAITQHIKDTLPALKDELSDNFVVNNGSYPHIVNLYLQGKISLEALTILAKITNSEGYWRENVLDKTVFPDILRKLVKYEPFLIYEKEKITAAVKSHFF
jgi:hypothetical protein